MFHKTQLKEAYKTLRIGSDWIRWLEDDLGISRSTLDTLAALALAINFTDLIISTPKKVKTYFTLQIQYFRTLFWDDIMIICWWKLSKQTGFFSV